MAKLSGNHAVAIGKNPERSREHNRRVVLAVVRQHGSLGRAHIAKLTQLTAQAVANIVDELVSEGLLMQLGRRKTERGQPPIQFAVDPEGGATIGVEIAADHVVTVALDLSGKLRHQRILPLEDRTPDGILATFSSEFVAMQRAVRLKLLGAGVVMPGPFEIEGMTSVGPTTLPAWGGRDASQTLSEACGHPVVVENDATAAAVGERLFGAGREIANFCMVYFGVGLGLGMIQEGSPYRGAFGNAGEIGHITIKPRGKPCPSCGQRGCLEGYVSTYALREKLQAAGISNADFETLERLHGERHPVIAQWVREAADHLGPVLAMLENILDPQTLILGGTLPDRIIDDVIAGMNRLPTSVASRRQRDLPRIMRGQTGQLTAALGAAALPLFDMVTPKLEISLQETGAQT